MQCCLVDVSFERRGSAFIDRAILVTTGVNKSAWGGGATEINYVTDASSTRNGLVRIVIRSPPTGACLSNTGAYQLIHV